MRVSGTTPPGPRVASVEGTARALRRAIAAHNRQVLLIATFTLLVAALLWAVLYAFFCWVLLFCVVVAAPSVASTMSFGSAGLVTSQRSVRLMSARPLLVTSAM